MNLFKPPKFKIEDFDNPEIIKNLINWFFRRDHTVKKFLTKGKSFFNEGFHPTIWDKNDKNSSNFELWLLDNVISIFKKIKNSNDQELELLIKSIDKNNIKTSDKLWWDIGVKYQLSSDNVLFNPEINKITSEKDKKEFMSYLLDSYCQGITIRILNWVNSELYGKVFIPKEN